MPLHTFKGEMAHNRAKKKKTVARQIGVSSKTLSAKISKVAHEDPGKSHKAVVGKAVGILKHKKKK
jgi:hypothetical protein